MSRQTMTIVNRTTSSMSSGGGLGGGSSYERSSKISSGRGMDMGGHPDYSSLTTIGVNSVKESRAMEKKDMQDLNERFANYIDKVRYLEAQNRKLADDLNKLKEKWGKETAQVKAMFQAELDEARRQLDDAEKEKARLEIHVASLEEQLEELRLELNLVGQQLADYRERIAANNQRLLDYENEIQMLRKRIEQLETEKDKDKKMIEQLKELLAKARDDLDNETLNHIDAENRRQTLEEEIEFLKSIHEQEMKELAALAYRDTAPDRDYWKNEMAQAIREIQQMYDDKMDSMRTELESYYTTKVSEFKTGAAKQNIESERVKEDTTKIRQDMADLRDKLNELTNLNAKLQRELELLRREKEDRERELEAQKSQLQGEAMDLRMQLDEILRQLQRIMDSKLGLELEIAAYRKLLEGEENRLSRRSAIDQSAYSSSSQSTFGKSSRDDAQKGMSAVGSMSAKTTYHKSALGPISISDVTPDGKKVELQNTGTKDENIEGWKICRVVDGREIPEYVLDNRYSNFKRGSKICIWGKGQKPKDAAGRDTRHEEAPFESWQIGAQATTRLVSPDGEEKATHTQKTVYSS